MAVRLADARDTDLVKAHYADLGLDEFFERGWEAILESDHDFVFSDEEHGTHAWWTVSHDVKVVRLVSLLPLGTPVASLLPVFRTSALATAAVYPGALDYEVEAYFPDRLETPTGLVLGETLARTWQSAFAGSLVAQTLDRTRWRISLPTFRQAIEVIERWPTA